MQGIVLSPSADEVSAGRATFQRAAPEPIAVTRPAPPVEPTTTTTSTTTTTTTAPPLTQDQLIDATVAHYFGPYADQALRIVWCESGRRVSVISRTNDYGLFQINRRAHQHGLVAELGYTMNDMLDLEPNVIAAATLFQRSGFSWRPWSCARKVGLR